MIESVVFKGKRIPKGHRMHSHHHSSVGDLLQGIGDMVVSPRSSIMNNNNLFSTSYHHHDSSNAADTFNLDQVTPKAPVEKAVQDTVDKAMQHDHDQDHGLRELAEQSNAGGDNQDHPSLPKKRDRPYLILDIRDVDDYKVRRIVTSKSYPAPR